MTKALTSYFCCSAWLGFLFLLQDLSACLIEVANGKAREVAETKAANQLRAQIDELYKFDPIPYPLNENIQI